MKERNTRIFYGASFLLPLILTLILFALRGISPFGNITFLKKDLYQQYTPFFYEYYRKLKSGESLWYSWNAGTGANFLSVIAYYLASPLNLLSILFPEKHILEFMTYCVVIKTALMGVTAAAFLSYHFRKKDPAMVFFSLCYAMSAYMAAYSWNIEWMDVLFIAPLVIRGLEKISDSGSPLEYCLSLSYAIFTNYYLSIMLCIFAVLYFTVLNILKGFNVRNVIKFLIFSLLSGGAGAVLILPEYFCLRFTTFTNIKFPKKFSFYMNPADLFLRHLCSVETETGLGHSPNIYCGVLILFLLMVYLLSRRVPLKEKLCYSSLLLFFLLSFNINQLNFIWHGLNFPDSLPARQGYLYVLLLMTIGYEGFTLIRSSSTGAFAASLIIPSLLSLFVLLYFDSGSVNRVTLVSNLIFFILEAAALTAYRAAPDKEFFPGNGMETMLFYIVLSILSLELTVNMFFTNNRTIKRTDYFKRFDDFRVLNEEMKKANEENGSPLSRADEVSRNVRNDSMIIGCSSLSFFSSTVNGLLIKNLSKYGVMNSRVFYLADGTTGFTSMLYGQKYIFVPGDRLFSDEDTAFPVRYSNGSVLYEKKYHIPNGYVLRVNDDTTSKLFLPVSAAEKIIDAKITSPNGDETAADAQNVLINDLGISGTVLMRYGDEDKGTITREKGRVILGFSDDCHLYAYDNTKTEGELTIRMSDGTPAGKMSSNKYRYFYDLGYHKKGTTVSFISENPDDENADLEFYRLNPSVLESFADSLNSCEHLEDIKVGSDSLTGTIDMKRKGHLVLQVPYEPGWSLYVDGRYTHIDLFDGLWISTDLSEGKHDIRISFFPKGLRAGFIISLISLILSALLLKYESILRRRRLYRELKVRRAS